MGSSNKKLKKKFRKLFLRLRATHRLKEVEAEEEKRTESVLVEVERMTKEKSDLLDMKQQLDKVAKELELEREANSRQKQASSRQVKELTEDVRRLEVRLAHQLGPFASPVCPLWPLRRPFSGHTADPPHRHGLCAVRPRTPN